MEELISLGDEHSDEELKKIALDLKGIASSAGVTHQQIADVSGYCSRHYINKLLNASTSLSVRNLKMVQDAIFSIINSRMQKAA